MPRKRLVQFLGGLGLATAPGYPTSLERRALDFTIKYRISVGDSAWAY